MPGMGQRLKSGSQPCCKERAGTKKKNQGEEKKNEIRGRVQSREGNLVALVMRASSSQAHFVLFSTVESGKSYLWKWKKGSQPAESHHSSRSRCRVRLQRVITALHSPLLQTNNNNKKIQAKRRKTCFRKNPLQPQNNLSARAESELLTAEAPACPEQQAFQQGTTTQELLENPAIPGMQPKPEPAASFTLHRFSLSQARFFLTIKMPMFQPHTKHASFRCFKIPDPQLQTPTRRPNQKKDVKPHGLTPKSYTAPLAPERALRSPPPRVSEIAASTLLLVHGFPEMKPSAGTLGRREGWGRNGGGRGSKKSHGIQCTARLTSTGGSFQRECMARSTQWLHAAMLAQRPQLPGVCEGKTGKVSPRSLIRSRPEVGQSRLRLR